MMRLRQRQMMFGAAVLAFAAIAIWVGVPPLHDHLADPGCQVCKLAHYGAVDVVNPTALQAVHSVGQALLAAVPPLVPAAPAPTPPGRAPPHA